MHLQLAVQSVCLSQLEHYICHTMTRTYTVRLPNSNFSQVYSEL